LQIRCFLWQLIRNRPDGQVAGQDVFDHKLISMFDELKTGENPHMAIPAAARRPTIAAACPAGGQAV
jgi:hypothetical protein